MTRPLMLKSIDELEQIVQRNAQDDAELRLVTQELAFRSTHRAAKLQAAIEGLLDGDKERPLAQPQPDGPAPAISGHPADPRIRRLFDETRRRLVETGTRNRLVHVNRANTRGSLVNVANERSDDVYAILVSEKAMRFQALGRDRQDTGDIVLADGDDPVGPVDEARYTDTRLETMLGPDALAKKLLAIARDARTAEEEQGVNILYLALGFVTWFEDEKSSVKREAPLVLLPVELIRNSRSATYDLRLRADDLITNLPLQQRWLDDFGLRLPELKPDDDWKPSDYFQDVQAIVDARTRWSVERDAMQLGFFSFSKLLMHRDLDPDMWPDGALEHHPLVRGLLYEGFEAEEPLFPADVTLDEVLPPEKVFHVVDADASQARVIEEARAGRNLVVQGPPGTGKSQTIANIIAAAAREGKRVLFVAEKMAALEVVHERLLKVGLGDICLELHSRGANKRQVLEELKRTLNAAAAIPAMPPPPAVLTQQRDRLNAIAGALHEPIGETGETAFAMLGRQARFIGLGICAPVFEGIGLDRSDRDAEDTAIAALQRHGRAVATGGDPAVHPFRGVTAIDLQPVDVARLPQRLQEANEAIASLSVTMGSALDSLGLEPAGWFGLVPTLIALLEALGGLDANDAAIARTVLACPDRARLAEGVNAGSRWRAARDLADERFAGHAFDADAGPLRAPLTAGAASFFARWGSAYRGASRDLGGMLTVPLPRSADDRIEAVDELLAIAALRREWNGDSDWLATTLGQTWRGERTDWDRLSRVLAWADSVVQANAGLDADADALVATALVTDRPMWVSDLGDRTCAAQERTGAVRTMLQIGPDRFDEAWDDAPLQQIGGALAAMAANAGRYGEWVELVLAGKDVRAARVEPLAERVASGASDSSAAVTEYRFARAEAIWKRALRDDPLLSGLSGVDRHALAAQFGQLEKAHLRDNVTSIVAAHLAQLPRGALGEMKLLRGEMGKKRGHMALRRLFSQASNAIQRIKPVLLMSPISVAQFLTPGKAEFDLLLIDEASQVRPEDALGAVARAKQIVVVGDQKQLPPTSFFDRLSTGDGDGDGDGADEAGATDDEDAAADPLGGAAQLGELESILTLCEARGLSTRMLEWHYRSRDPSLIRVSNREFYHDRLILPPSPLEKDPAYGLTFTKVDGVYDKGGRRHNLREGEALVARVCEHARATPDLSLGIVTFSAAQKNAITELLELARRDDAALDDLLREGPGERVFVKNIENVQGDERDVIFISVGYGPSEPGGRMIGASFGPVNLEGGERRLNVLFTRARLRCEVFASFDPAELDVSRASREGPRVFKRFLDYAKTRQIADHAPSGAAADSPFEEDVADAIRSLGWLADPQVGSAGFRIDIGVRHPEAPGRYVLAVECDGATYHSALWARERDRLRQGVLEHLGWRFHRIWSTDWFYNRQAEIARLGIALKDAMQHAERGAIEAPAKAEEPSEREHAPPGTQGLPDVAERAMPRYTRVDIRMAAAHEPHEAPLAELMDLVTRIVEAEGPISLEETARRLSACYGRERSGRRILDATFKALCANAARDVFVEEDGFYMTHAQRADPPVRDRSGETGATVKADAISPQEIRAALAIALADNAGIEGDALIRAAARLLGYQRVGAELKARISANAGPQS